MFFGLIVKLASVCDGCDVGNSKLNNFDSKKVAIFVLTWFMKETVLNNDACAYIPLVLPLTNSRNNISKLVCWSNWMIYKYLFFYDFKNLHFLIKINHQYFHTIYFKRRKISNHNITRLGKITILVFCPSYLSFWLQQLCFRSSWNLVNKNFSKICRGKSSSFEISQKFLVFYKSHTALIIIFRQVFLK